MSFKNFENLTLALLSQIEHVKTIRATFHYVLQFIVCKSTMYGSHYYNITLYFDIFTTSLKINDEIQFSYFLLILLVSTIIGFNFHNFLICSAIFSEIFTIFKINSNPDAKNVKIKPWNYFQEFQDTFINIYRNYFLD